MKLLSHLMKLLHLMILLSQQICLCGTLFNVHDTSMKHVLRLALVGAIMCRVRAYKKYRACGRMGPTKICTSTVEQFLVWIIAFYTELCKLICGN